MKQFLLLPFSLIVFALSIQAQSTKLEIPIVATGGQVSDTLGNGQVVVLDLSTDDAEQENNEVDTPFDDDLDAGWEGEPADQNILTCGLRFQNVTIPKGSTIDSAYLILTSHEEKLATDVAKITIVGEATDDAATFDSVNFNDNYLLTDRPETAAKILWTVDEPWTIWQPYKSIDIAPIIQELVNRAGWQSGNSIALILKGEDQGPSVDENAREFEAFENIADPDDVDPNGNPGDGKNHPERVPKLVVFYDGAVGIQALTNTDYAVYPNPASRFVTVKRPATMQGTATVSLYQINGELVLTETISDIQWQIPTHQLAKGMYLLRIVEENGLTFEKKFMVQ